jgi:hypothetical protein
MKTVAFILSLLAASAAAFQSVQPAPSSTALMASSYDGTFGTGPETANKCPPYGAYIFDNIGERGQKWFQVAEIKNGRVRNRKEWRTVVRMLGTIVVAHGKCPLLRCLGCHGCHHRLQWGVHFPLYLGPSGSNAFSPASGDTWYLSESAGITFSDLANAPTPLDAIQMIPLFGLYQILFVAGWFELLAAGRQQSDIPGNFGYDPLGFTKRPGGFDSPEIKSLRVKEVKNGRLAM